MSEREDLIEEHERLIRRLKSGTRLEEEAKEQEKDLKKLKEESSLARFINKMEDGDKERMIELLQKSMESEDDGEDEESGRPDLSRVKRPSKLFMKKHEKDGGNYLI